MNLNIFTYELKHFYRNKAKLYSYIVFMFLSLYALINVYNIKEKQQDTINEIYHKQEQERLKVIKWYENNQIGPDDKSWVNINDPFWAILYNPTYVLKTPQNYILWELVNLSNMVFTSKLRDGVQPMILIWQKKYQITNV